MPASLRLLTYNIAHGRGLSLYQGLHGEKRIRRNLEKISQLINTCRADVAALQEVDQDSHWNQRLDLLQLLREDSNLEHALYGINNVRGGRKNLAYGNGFLSRYPIHLWQNTPFAEASLGGKGFLYAEIDWEGHHLPVINLHLDYRSRRRRIEQIERIIAFITDRPHPQRTEERLAPIICGDFNSRSGPIGDAVSHLFRFVQNHGHYRILPEGARTFPAQLPSKTIDFILLPEPYRLLHCEVIRSFASDHRPVLAEFTLDQQP